MQAEGGNGTQLAARLGWALLILATLYVCYFRHLGAIGFVGPDEPRYAWVAREMVESRDWVTPRLYGQPWFEKPPLYYWGAALSFKLFGASEAAARLPSAVSALLATLALAWLAWRVYGAETARWLLLLLPTTVGMIGFSRAAATDMPFSAMLTIAMVCAAVALGLAPSRDSGVLSLVSSSYSRSEVLARTPWLALFLFGFFLGAAVLAKGPVAIILCGGTVFFWALFTNGWRDAFHLLHPLATASFSLTALPWYVLCASRNPDFLRVFLIEHNFRRYLTPEFHHVRPFWYFGPVLLIGLLPWVTWLAWFLFGARKGGDADSHAVAMTFFLALWAFLPVIFFSASKSKLPGYVLPSVPPLALLIGRAFVISAKRKPWFSRAALFLTALLFLASAIWVMHDVYIRPPWTHVPRTVLIGGILLLSYVVPAIVGGLVVIGAAVLNRVRAGRMLALLVFLFLVMASTHYLPKLNPHLSVKTAASEIKTAGDESAYAYQLRRSWLYGLNFYLHREVPEWNPSVKSPAIVVTPRASLTELKNHVEIVAVISDSWDDANVVRVRPQQAQPQSEPAQPPR